jgi:hypothetical protein
MCVSHFRLVMLYGFTFTIILAVVGQGMGRYVIMIRRVNLGATTVPR